MRKSVQNLSQYPPEYAVFIKKQITRCPSCNLFFIILCNFMHFVSAYRILSDAEPDTSPALSDTLSSVLSDVLFTDLLDVLFSDLLE